ncbi:MAG: OmpH family outer membrane protein [Pseudomonadota bacterium]
MKHMTKLMASALVASAAMAATPAMAQVNGIATTDPATAIAASQARGTAYQQIETTYASQIQTLQQKRQQAQELGKQLDTDGNGEVSDQEAAAAQSANNPVLQQINSIQREIDSLSAPIALAQIYALEQITQQFNAAQQQVVSDKNISVILTPEAFVYAPPAADVTNDIVTALNTRLPAVSTAVPADWQPSRQGQQLHQRVQQILVISALQQRAAQQQQQQQTTTQQPTGR